MPNISIEMGIVSVILSLVGKMGPIEIDTRVAAWNDNLSPKEYEKMIKKDVMVVGERDKQITPWDLQKFLQRANKYANNKVFDNGRSYILEGISGSKSSFYFEWGS